MKRVEVKLKRILCKIQHTTAFLDQFMGWMGTDYISFKPDSIYNFIALIKTLQFIDDQFFAFKHET